MKGNTMTQSRAWILIGVALLAQASGAVEPDTRLLAVQNTSDSPVVIVLHTPSDQELKKVTVPVPAQSAVYNVPIPKVEDDQFAIAFSAIRKEDRIEAASPRRVIGYQKLFTGSGANTGENRSIPILVFRGSSAPGSLGLSSAMHSPLFEDDAKRLLAHVTKSANGVDFRKRGRAEQ